MFGIELKAYWHQFPRLKERLERYRGHVKEQLGCWADVVSMGLVDTSQGTHAADERSCEG